MLQNEERINVRFALAIGFFKYQHFVIREYGTLGPKYFGDALLLIVIMKSMNVAVKGDVVR